MPRAARLIVAGVTLLLTGDAGRSVAARTAAPNAEPQAAPVAGSVAAQLPTDVGSPDATVRRAALRRIAADASPESLVLLGWLVADRENDIQERAIETVLSIYVEPPPRRQVGSAEAAFDLAPYYALPWAPPEELTRGLIQALADDWPSVRRDAAYALAVITSPPPEDRIADELVQSLFDREHGVRLAAARALGRLRARSAGLPLIGAVNDEYLPVRLAAMRALGDIREQMAVIALTEQFDFYYRGSAGRASLDALARIAHPSSASLFEAHSASANSSHRRSAYEGLGRLGVGAAATRIEDMLAAEREPSVVLAMAFALAAAGRPYVDRIVESLADDDLEGQALDYLVDLGQDHAETIVGHLKHSNPVVRQRVAMALGFIGGEAVQAALSEAATDPSPDVSRAARTAQARLRLAAERGAAP